MRWGSCGFGRGQSVTIAHFDHLPTQFICSQCSSLQTFFTWSKNKRASRDKKSWNNECSHWLPSCDVLAELAWMRYLTNRPCVHLNVWHIINGSIGIVVHWLRNRSRLQLVLVRILWLSAAATDMKNRRSARMRTSVNKRTRRRLTSKRGGGAGARFGDGSYKECANLWWTQSQKKHNSPDLTLKFS